MIEISKNGNRGIRWTLTSILEDLDYADDIGLVSNRHKDMQEKMDKLTTTAPQIGLKLNTAKTKLMRINNKTDNPIIINNINNSDALEDVQDFAYLGSKITTDGDSTVPLRVDQVVAGRCLTSESRSVSVCLALIRSPQTSLSG